MSAILFIVAGVTALLIKDKNQLGTTPTNGGTPSVVASTIAPVSVVGGIKYATTQDDSTAATDDITRKSKLLQERQKLRQQGVPEAEINMMLPIETANDMDV